jgi:8-oxo-dGTP pyrophosphatase MutT (NUDIX family)
MNTPARLAVATVPARPAATTLIVRDGPSGLDVLMVKRSMQASFMPGAYVFPGGAVDAADGAAPTLAACDEPADVLLQRIDSVTGVGDQAAAFAVAALRECFEECGLWLGAHAAAAVDWTALRARLHAGAALHDLATDAGAQLHTRGLQPWAHWVTRPAYPSASTRCSSWRWRHRGRARRSTPARPPRWNGCTRRRRWRHRRAASSRWNSPPWP